MTIAPTWPSCINLSVAKTGCFWTLEFTKSCSLKTETTRPTHADHIQSLQAREQRAAKRLRSFQLFHKHLLAGWRQVLHVHCDCLFAISIYSYTVDHAILAESYKMKIMPILTVQILPTMIAIYKHRTLSCLTGPLLQYTQTNCGRHNSYTRRISM